MPSYILTADSDRPTHKVLLASVEVSLELLLFPQQSRHLIRSLRVDANLGRQLVLRFADPLLQPYNTAIGH